MESFFSSRPDSSCGRANGPSARPDGPTHATPIGSGLALFAVWTLLSAGWSDAPARAMIEFDRALAYLLVVVLIGSLAVASVLTGAGPAANALIQIACVAGLVAMVRRKVLFRWIPRWSLQAHCLREATCAILLFSPPGSKADSSNASHYRPRRKQAGQ